MVRSRSTSVKPLTTKEIVDEEVDPLFMVWLVARSAEDLLDTVLATTGIHGDEFAIYSILAASPGITPSDLSRWMAAPPTSVSSYVKRLEARGHLTRRPHPKDRRSYRIHLTTAGQRTHQAAIELFRPIPNPGHRVTGRPGRSGPRIPAAAPQHRRRAPNRRQERTFGAPWRGPAKPQHEATIHRLRLGRQVLRGVRYRLLSGAVCSLSTHRLLARGPIVHPSARIVRHLGTHPRPVTTRPWAPPCHPKRSNQSPQ